MSEDEDEDDLRPFALSGCCHPLDLVAIEVQLSVATLYNPLNILLWTEARLVLFSVLTALPFFCISIPCAPADGSGCIPCAVLPHSYHLSWLHGPRPGVHKNVNCLRDFF